MDEGMYILFLIVYWSCVAWGLWWVARGLWRFMKKHTSAAQDKGVAEQKDVSKP